MKRSARSAEPDVGAAVTASGREAAKVSDAAAKRSAKAAEAVSGAGDGRKFARVSMSGRSQVVRLPKEFRLDTDRVGIRREGCEIVLTPVFKDWEDYWANSTRLPDDFEAIIEEMRREMLPLEDREPFE